MATKRDDTKYLWCNFHSLFNHQGLEIRLLEGTLNTENVLSWIALHQNFIDFVANMKDIAPNVLKISKEFSFDKSLEKYIEKRRKIHDISHRPLTPPQTATEDGLMGITQMGITQRIQNRRNEMYFTSDISPFSITSTTSDMRPITIDPSTTANF